MQQPIGMTVGKEALPLKGALKGSRKNIVAGVLGNFVEFFDWNIYAYLAPIFVVSYFPETDRVSGLLMVFSIFALGILTRPLGALLFGLYSDKAGRRNAISITILGMAIASFVIGSCPTYLSIGIMAPIILLVARLTQGLSAGGEGGNAATYLVESAPSHLRATVGGFREISTGLATLTSLSAAALLTNSLTPETLNAWGWRIPFWIGGILGVVGLYIRLKAGETPAFEAGAQHPQRPSLKLVATEWRTVLLVSAVGFFPTITFLTWQIYFPTFLSLATGISQGSALEINVVGVIVYVLLIYPMARIADVIGRRPMLITYAAGAILWGYPTFVGLPTFANPVVGAIIVCVVGNALQAIGGGALIAAMAEAFQTKIRATGFGLSYAIAVTVGGAIFPPLVTYLAGNGHFMGIFAFFVPMGVISLIAYIIMPERGDKSLTGPSITV